MKTRMGVDDLALVAVPSQPAVSPDQQRIVYVLRDVDTVSDLNVDRLWCVPASGGSARPLTNGPSDIAPAWSPDGSQIAFLRGGQVHLLDATGGEPRQMTTLPLGAGAPTWSPDGTQIAFASPVDPARDAGPMVSDGLNYQADGSGMFGSIRYQLHLLDVRTGECRQVSDSDEHALSPAWSPDGTKLAYISGRGPYSDLSSRVSVQELIVSQPHRQPPVRYDMADADSVRYTNDGRHLLVVGSADEPGGHARLLKVALDDGEAVDLTRHLDLNVMPGAPAYPGGDPQETEEGSILFCVRDAGCTHVWAVEGTAGQVKPVLTGRGRVVSGLSAVGATAAVVLSTPTSYGEIATMDLHSGVETVLTRHGAALMDKDLFRREERSFTISDGLKVQAWLTRDPARTGPLPLLLDIHGGPHNAWNAAADHVHMYHQELASRGWAVLLINARGSDGYGEEFFRAVNGGWGVADSADFLEPLDQLVAEGVADPSRLAVTGYSYGGFMTCWLTGRDDRFAAAVAGGVISDLVSMQGTSAAGSWLASFDLGLLPWQAPERYAQMSPLTRVEDVTTPTLILHGDADLTCPVGQAQQWFAALRALDVPTRLVLYPGASHAFPVLGSPAQRMDYNRRVVDWLERHVTGGGRPGIDAAHWEHRLQVLAQRHGVPGAQLGILRARPDSSEQVTTTYGVLNVDTQVPVTPASVFQIGAITKACTATVAMQLVEAGLLDLDAPIADVLPGFELADQAAGRAVTLRHLLTHTSGIDGDIFSDTGRGDDCLQVFVERLTEAGQSHPPGLNWSYCNSGFSVIGRVIEQITGKTWDQAMRELLFSPLGLTHTGTFPEEAILHPAAVGHLNLRGAARPAPMWQLPRSLGPAGLMFSNAADVLAFARAHFASDLVPDDVSVLSEAGVTQMAARHAQPRDHHILGHSWGLGWKRFDGGGERVVGHDGSTIGQAAFLRLLPDRGLAVVLLTNGGNAGDLHHELFGEVFSELAGITVPRPLTRPSTPHGVGVTRHLGTYTRAAARLDVLDGEQGPRLRVTPTGPIASLSFEEVEELPIVPITEDLCVVQPAGTRTWLPLSFYELSTGERYLHCESRAARKVS